MTDDVQARSAETGRSWVPLGLVLAVLTIVSDQASKYYVIEVLGLTLSGPPIVLTGWLNFDLVLNRGISFSLFSGASDAMPWILTGVALTIAGIMLVWLFRARGWLTALALGLVIGGAIGNAIDRVRLGAVIDFVDFHIPAWNDWHFATFNLADSAISTGVFLLLAAALFGGGESRR